MNDENTLTKVSAGLTAENGWIPLLNKLDHELNNLAKETENEFLSLGMSLQTFSISCQENSSQAVSIAQMIEDGSGFNVNSFKELFEKVYREIEQTAGIITDGLEGIESLLVNLKKILGLEGFLNKLSRSITIIGTLIRIETARVGNADFNVTTGMVDKLGKQILKGTKGIVASAKQAIDKVSSLSSGLSPCISLCDTELHKSRIKVKSILEELDEMSKQAKWLCERIGGRASQITPEIGEVVSAIQYHDITRQQMEHIGETAEEMVERINSLNSLEEKEKVRTLRWVLEAIKIQINQSKHVINETNKAASKITQHLSQVSDLSEAQAEDASLILEEEETGKNRIQMIGVALDALASILQAIKNMTTDMMEAIREASENMVGMNEQVSNIESISENINLLALNAIIKVARTGVTGRGLGVLAEEISKISKKAKSHISEGSAAINEIIATSNEFRTKLYEQLQYQLVSSENVSREARDAIQQLITDDEILMKSMGDISTKTKALEKDIHKVISGISFHKLIETRLTQTMTAFDDLFAQMIERIPKEAIEDAELAPDMTVLQSKYTMESERAIQSKAISKGQDDNGLWLDGGDNGAGSDKEFGDNIDLF
ncbi:methyl-accepting chemotaxis sensory transducer [Candidatus Magnetoovum chiemensis]|nr:methyl-accepting chemotaxis sensory transducer [Candidatus Magnetoovum chiemensis]